MRREVDGLVEAGLGGGGSDVGVELEVEAGGQGLGGHVRLFVLGVGVVDELLRDGDESEELVGGGRGLHGTAEGLRQVHGYLLVAVVEKLAAKRDRVNQKLNG